MELEEIKERLDNLGIPVAYMQFNTPQKPPFLVYYEDGGKISGADYYNLIRRINVRFELYSDQKNTELEIKLENLFRDIELEKEPDVYLPKEEMFVAGYVFENIQAVTIEED